MPQLTHSSLSTTASWRWWPSGWGTIWRARYGQSLDAEGAAGASLRVDDDRGQWACAAGATRGEPGFRETRGRRLPKSTAAAQSRAGSSRKRKNGSKGIESTKRERSYGSSIPTGSATETATNASPITQSHSRGGKEPGGG